MVGGVQHVGDSSDDGGEADPAIQERCRRFFIGRVESRRRGTAGATRRGIIVPTKVDDEVAEKQKPYEGFPFEITIEQIVPERHFSFRWHPFAVEPGVDYSHEPTTLVAFELEQVGPDIRLTVTESGFDRIPLARRAQAFAANEGGWTMVVTLIEKYLAKNR